MKKKILIILIIAVCGILIYGVHYLKTPLNSQKAERIAEEVSMNIEAVFVRDEDVYTAPGSGYAYYAYTDGERVRKGAFMASVYSGTPTENQLKALSTIDRKLKASMYSGTNSIDVNTDPEAAENKIDEYRREIIKLSNNNDLAAVARYKAMINAVRANDSTVEAIDTAESLNGQRKSVEQSIGYGKFDIYSEQSGVFTTILDGLETVLTPDNVDSITLDELNSVRNTQGKATESLVDKENVMFKIVNNHEWYVLAPVDTEKISDYKVGKRINVSFENMPGEITEGKIISIKGDEKDKSKSVLLIQCQKYLEGAYSFRQSKGKIIFDTYEGYKVPVYAIRVENDQKGVLAEKNNRTNFYPVNVLYTNAQEGYAIVDSVKDAKVVLDDAEYIILGER